MSDDAREGGRPQDERVSRRWFLNRMAWVSSAAATGVLVAPRDAQAGSRGRALPEEAFTRGPSPSQVGDPTELTMSEAMALVRRGTLDPADLVVAHWERAERHNPTLLAYADRPSRAEALAQLERAPANAPLRGIPLAPKDNFYTTDMLTEGGSLVYRGFQPTYDATAVRLMRAAGGVIIGKAQMGNLAGGRAQVYGTTTPTTRNAWTPDDIRYSPAGSSSGTGTAVAARFAIAGLGTQTGGSVMGPGNAQGLTCVKPTFGRVSLHGVIPLSYTRDHVGAMARNALDAAILLQIIAQPDENDPRTLGLPAPPNYLEAATAYGGDSPRLRWPMRIGVWPGYLSAESGGRGGGDERDQAHELELRRAMIAQLEGLGAEIVPEVRLPDQWEELTAEPLGGSTGDPTAFFIEHLRRDVRNFGDRLPRFLNGMLQSADTYVKVQQARNLLRHRILTQLFDQCDVVVAGSGTGAFDGTGLPLLCMPIGFDTEPRTGNQVPRGVVLGGRPFGEERLLSVAAAYQAVTDFHTRRPPDPSA